MRAACRVREARRLALSLAAAIMSRRKSIHYTVAFHDIRHRVTFVSLCVTFLIYENMCVCLRGKTF